MGAPGYDTERLADGAMEAGAAAILAGFPPMVGMKAGAPRAWLRKQARPIAVVMLTGMAEAGWTFTPPPAGHVPRPAFDPNPPEDS